MLPNRTPAAPTTNAGLSSPRRQWSLLTGLVAAAVVCLSVEEFVGMQRMAELFEDAPIPDLDWAQFLVAWSLWLAAAPFVAWLGLRCVPGRMPWWLALLAHVMSAFAGAFVICQLEMWSAHALGDTFDEADIRAAEPPTGVLVVEASRWWFVLGYAWRFGILSVVAVVPSLAMLNSERERRRDQLLRELAETENRLLRAQLQPHFLFNALNGIQVLIDDDPNRAKVVLRRLSALLRNTLEDAHQTLLPLSRELEILEDYLELERLRLGDRVRITLEAEPGNDDVLVPSFCLQPLVENSLIHGPGARVAGGSVGISIRRAGDALEMEVRDDGPGVPTTDRPTNGHGLGILEQRLLRAFDARASLHIHDSQPHGFAVTIRVPAAGA